MKRRVASPAAGVALKGAAIVFQMRENVAGRPVLGRVRKGADRTNGWKAEAPFRGSLLLDWDGRDALIVGEAVVERENVAVLYQVGVAPPT